MTVVLLGATKGVGRAVARELAARRNRLVLLGRHPDDLARSAADLDARAGQPVVAGTAVCDLARPETFGPALEAAAAALGQIDTVIVTAGEFGTQDALEADLERCRSMLTVNFAHTVLFCEQARPYLMANGGTLCVVSSVAGDRGRKPVVLYGASKAGLSAYLEGLDHRYRHAGLKVVSVKPGFVKTSMTAGLPPPPFAGEPGPVARDLVRAIDKGTPVVYTPWPWKFVMHVIRRLPRAVMRRVRF